MQLSKGDNVQVQRSSGKMEWNWTVEAVLPGYAPMGLEREVVVVAKWQGETIRKTVKHSTLVAWQTYAVCDTVENLTTCEAPSAV